MIEFKADIYSRHVKTYEHIYLDETQITLLAQPRWSGNSIDQPFEKGSWFFNIVIGGSNQKFFFEKEDSCMQVFELIKNAFISRLVINSKA